MWLRMLEGVDATQFEQCTGFRVDDLCGGALRSLAEEDLLDISSGRWGLSRRALFVCNSVFAELV